MKRYNITLVGCDDATNVYMTLSDTEIETIRRLMEATDKASTYRCQPTIEIIELKEEEQV